MVSFEQLEQHILQYLEKQNSNTEGKPYELEIRIGRFKKDREGTLRFNTTLSAGSHIAAQKFLHNQYWAKIEETEFIEYKRGSKRVRFNEVGDIAEHISKRRVKETDFTLPDYPFAVRVSLSTEKKLQEPTVLPDSTWKKTLKKRKSFYREFFSIDLTASSLDHHDIYQEEIEIRPVHLSQRVEKHFAEELTNLTMSLLRILAPFPKGELKN